MLVSASACGDQKRALEPIDLSYKGELFNMGAQN